MDFSFGDALATAVAVSGFLGVWWRTAHTTGKFENRINTLENRVEETEKEQDKILESLQRVTTQLAVVDSTLRDTRDERVRFHTETQVNFSELRRDVTRILSAVAQLRGESRLSGSSELS